MNELAEVQEDDEHVFANDVEWHQPDGSGRNWDMHGYRGPRGYGTEIRLLVDRMRREYRLSEEAETRPAEYRVWVYPPGAPAAARTRHQHLGPNLRPVFASDGL